MTNAAIAPLAILWLMSSLVSMKTFLGQFFEPISSCGTGLSGWKELTLCIRDR